MARDGRTSGLGVALLTLSLVALFVAWPPPGAGVPPLLGVEHVLFTASASWAPLLVAMLGGAVLARQVTSEAGLARRLVVGVAGPVVPVALEAAYLTYVVGFGPPSTAIGWPVAVAALVGVAAEIPR